MSCVNAYIINFLNTTRDLKERTLGKDLKNSAILKRYVILELFEQSLLYESSTEDNDRTITEVAKSLFPAAKDQSSVDLINRIKERIAKLPTKSNTRINSAKVSYIHSKLTDKIFNILSENRKLNLFTKVAKTRRNDLLLVILNDGNREDVLKKMLGSVVIFIFY